MATEIPVPSPSTTYVDQMGVTYWTPEAVKQLISLLKDKPAGEDAGEMEGIIFDPSAQLPPPPPGEGTVYDKFSEFLSTYASSLHGGQLLLMGPVASQPGYDPENPYQAAGIYYFKSAGQRDSKLPEMSATAPVANITDVDEALQKPGNTVAVLLVAGAIGLGLYLLMRK